MFIILIVVVFFRNNEVILKDIKTAYGWSGWNHNLCYKHKRKDKWCKQWVAFSKKKKIPIYKVLSSETSDCQKLSPRDSKGFDFWVSFTMLIFISHELFHLTFHHLGTMYFSLISWLVVSCHSIWLTFFSGPYQTQFYQIATMGLSSFWGCCLSSNHSRFNLTDGNSLRTS